MRREIESAGQYSLYHIVPTLALTLAARSHLLAGGVRRAAPVGGADRTRALDLVLGRRRLYRRVGGEHWEWVGSSPPERPLLRQAPC